jgi:hypothetical protein
LPSSINIIGQDGKVSAGRPKKKYTMTGDMKERRKAKARTFQINWWRDWTQHKKFKSTQPMEPVVNDCPCGRSTFEHPNLPNSYVVAIDIYCPFIQMKRLGIM